MKDWGIIIPNLNWYKVFMYNENSILWNRQTKHLKDMK